MLGALFDMDTIIIYNILSGMQISSHSVQGVAIWTHNECLQFAAVGSESITIWEVSFTSPNTPMQISSLFTPDNFSGDQFVFLPIVRATLTLSS